MTDSRLDLPLHDAAWLRRLARSLARDAHQAEDAAQEAWLAALKRPAEETTHRGWLSSVLRNALRQDERKRLVREHHQTALERAHKGDAAQPDPERRLELQSQVLQAVRELAEPYRDAIVARYFEGLSPRQIAQRSDTPVRTIHSRLHRALEQLRQRLDDQHQGRRHIWSMALLAIAEPPTPWIGLTLMSSKLPLVCSLAALMVGILWFGPVGSNQPLEGGGERELEVAAAVPLAETEVAAREAVSPAAVERQELQDEEPGTQAVEEPAQRRRVEGQVLDLQGAPVATVTVLSSVDQATTLSDGTFEIETDVASRGDLRVESAAWLTVYAADVRPDGPADGHRIVVAPPIELQGRTVEENGQAVVGARLEVSFRHEPLRDFPWPMDRSLRRSFEAQSDESGAYTLVTPALPGVNMVVSHAEYEQRSLALPARTTHGLDISLERLDDLEALPVVRGRVVDSDGNPAADATVRLGTFTVRSASDGHFELRVGRTLDEDADLVASKPGYLPSLLDRYGEQVWGAEELDAVWLELGPESLSLSGRVVGVRGQALAGWRLRLVERQFIHVDDDEETIAIDELARESEFPWETDEQGAFRIQGLSEGPLVLRFWNPESYVSFDSQTLVAGSRDNLVRQQSSGLLERVEGLVVALDGTPIGGADVVLGFSTRPDPYGMVWQRARTTVSAEDGSFAFEDVPDRNVFLMVEGEGLQRATHFQEGSFPREGTEVVVERRFHLRFAGSGTHADATHMRVLAEDGETLGITTQGATGALTQYQFELSEGRSHVVLVSERVRTLVLYRDGTELERIPVQLAAGGVNEITR